MITLKQTPIDKVFEVEMTYFEDVRGGFIKVFQDSVWNNAGIDFKLRESYYSISHKNVIRGMHFQIPPYHHHKLVFCPQGAVMDVAVDLRKNSSTYGKFYQTLLSAENRRGLFIPEGCAHGFKSLENDTLTMYFVSTEYDKETDSGILWNSFGKDWECEQPIMSERDKNFVALTDFESPF